MILSAPDGLEPTTLSVRNIVALQGCPKRRPFGERTRCVMNEVSPKAETIDMEQPRTMERFAMLLVSSCSEHRFTCRRQRGAPSQLTAGAAVCGRVSGLGQQVK